MEIYNPDNIKEFRPNSKISNKIASICNKYKIKPNVQVYKSSDKINYRGLTLGNTITLHWSDMETAKSIIWVFCHEARHYIIAKKPRVFEPIEALEIEIASRVKRRKLHKMSVKSVYQTLIDIGMIEAICDLFATEEVGKDYGASWYNIRLKNKARREKNVGSNKN